MERTHAEGRVWLLFAGITVTVITLAAIHWSLDHPYGAHWDEAIYINEVLIDAQRLQHGMLLRLAGRILIKSWGRPPAYRILADPFLALLGFHTGTARLVTLACFGLSAWFVYKATRRVASPAAGAFAALIFSLAPQVVSASIWFSTEGPLYLATSAMIYYIFLCWTDASVDRSKWMGLGLAIGLGLLSKVSFLLIAFPVLGFWLVVDRWSHLGVPTLWSQRKAVLLALLLAAPWWVLNLKPAMTMTESARDYSRHSLGPRSVMMYVRWFDSFYQGQLGYGLAILIGLVAIAYIRKAIVERDTIFSPAQKAALGACFCAGVPLVLAQLLGTNDLLRHISPSVIPLAIAVGVLADKTAWTHSTIWIALSGVLFCAQLAMILSPVLSPNHRLVESGLVNGSLPWQIMARRDQWNWAPVQQISHSCGVDSPRISYLGGGQGFTQPQIEFPWAAQGYSTNRAVLDYPEVKWLWRYENGPLDWQKVMGSIEQSDLVLTAPHYIGAMDGKDDFDNRYNAEFVERLSRDPRFRGPIRLEMGRFEPVEVDVFLKQSLVCTLSPPVR